MAKFKNQGEIVANYLEESRKEYEPFYISTPGLENLLSKPPSNAKIESKVERIAALKKSKYLSRQQIGEYLTKAIVKNPSSVGIEWDSESENVTVLCAVGFDQNLPSNEAEEKTLAESLVLLLKSASEISSFKWIFGENYVTIDHR